METSETTTLSEEAAAAKAEFETTNEFEVVDAAQDLYAYDEEAIQKELSARKWKTDPHYFKRAKISAKALLKIVMHAHSAAKGERKTEIMGMLLGKIVGEDMIVLDAFELPIQGEEAFVTAGEQANIYMSEFVGLSKESRPENCIRVVPLAPWAQGVSLGDGRDDPEALPAVYGPLDGHRHRPCPHHDVGKVELGAFRVYPAGVSAPAASSSGWEPVPSDLIEEFGVHKDEYYKMEVSYFKSKSDASLLDLLWEQYWVSALATNALISNEEYFAESITKVSRKLEAAEEEMAHSSSVTSARFRQGSFASSSRRGAPKSGTASKLAACADESAKFTVESLHALTTQVAKDALFNNRM